MSDKDNLFTYSFYLPRFFSRPTKNWQKKDWIELAKILASDWSPPGIINGVMYRGGIKKLKEKVGSHGSIQSKRRRGRPEILTVEGAKEFMQSVEKMRAELAAKEAKPVSKITSKEVAFVMAIEYKNESGGNERIQKYADIFEGRIKYSKKKMASGK